MNLDDYYKKMIQKQNEKTKHDKLFLDQFQASPDDFKVKRHWADYNTVRRYWANHNKQSCYCITRKSDGYKINLQSDHILAPKLNALIQMRHLEQVQYVKSLFKKLQWWKK